MYSCSISSRDRGQSPSWKWLENQLVIPAQQVTRYDNKWTNVLLFHFAIDLNWFKKIFYFFFFFFFLYYWTNIGVQLFPRPTSLHWSCFSRLGQGANSTHGEWKTFDWSSCQLFTQIDRAHRSSHTVGYVIRIITQMQSGPMIPFFLHF